MIRWLIKHLFPRSEWLFIAILLSGIFVGLQCMHFICRGHGPMLPINLRPVSTAML